MSVDRLEVIISSKLDPKGFRGALSASEELNSEITKTGKQADASARRADGAFGRIKRTIQKTRADAKAGAEFDLRASESGIGGITSAIGNIRADAAKGATFEVTGKDSGLSGLVARVKQAKADMSGKSTLEIEQKGGLATRQAVESVDASADRLDGRKVNLAIGGAATIAGAVATGAAIQALGNKLDLLSATTTRLGAQKLPLMMGALGGAPALISGVGTATLGLAHALGEGAAGFATIGGAAYAGAAGGLTAYSLAAESVVTEAFEVSEAMDKQAQRFGSMEAALAAVDAKNRGLIRTQMAFVDSVEDTQYAWEMVEKELSARMLPSFTRVINLFNSKIPELTPPLYDMAGGVSLIGERIAETVLEGQHFDQVGDVLNFVSRSAQDATWIIGNLGRAGLGAFQPIIGSADRLRDRIHELSAATYDWTRSTEGVRTMSGIVANLEGRMNQLLTVGKNVGTGLIGTFSAINESGVGGQLLSDVIGLSKGFSRVGVEGTKSRDTIISFAKQGVPLMRGAAGVAGELGTQFATASEEIISFRAEGSKMTVLQEIFSALKDSIAPVQRMMVGAFKGIGPELPDLIRNLSGLAETFAGTTPVLETYLGGMNSVLSAFNKLPDPVKNVVASTVAMSSVMQTTSGTSIPGMVGGLVSLYFNYALLRGVQGKATIGQRLFNRSATASVVASGAAASGNSGLAASNVAVGTTATGASRGMWLLRASMVALPVVAVGAGLVALAANWGKVTDRMGPFGQKLQQITARFNETNNIRRIFQQGIGTGLKKAFTDANGASSLWANGLEGLKQKFTDSQGASGGFKRTLAGIKTNLTDSKGASQAWAEGLPGLTEAITDAKGASGGFRDMLSGIKSRLVDNKGASQAWAEGLPGLKTALTDTQGASGGLRNALSGIKTKLTDNKGASAAWAEGLPGLQTRLTDTKGASGVLRGGLTSLMTKFVEVKASGQQNFGALYNTVSSKMAGSKNVAVARSGELLQDIRAKWTNTEGTTGEKFTAIRNLIGSRMLESKNRAISRTAEMGADLISRWTNQEGEAGSKFSGIADKIGFNAKDAKERASARIRELGSNLNDSWDNQLDAARGYGDSFKRILGDGFSGAVNLTRRYLGLLMRASANVLELVGADEIAGKADSLASRLESPIKFEKGGVVEAFAKGGLGTTAANPRMHLWNEQQGGEAFIAEKRPAREQLPYLQTAADWHGYAVIPANPAKTKIKHADYTKSRGFTENYADGGLAQTVPTIPVTAFFSGGKGAMYNAVLSKFGVKGHDYHQQYLSGSAAVNSIDWMVSPGGTKATGSQKELGDNIAAFTAPPSAKNTIWYGQANWGSGWTGYSTGPGIGNANTLGHYDHVHAEAHPDSFRGGKGVFPGGVGGFFSGVMDALGNAWNSVTDFLAAKFDPPAFPDLGLGIVGEGIAKLGGTVLDKTKDFLIAKATEFMGGSSGGTGGTAQAGANAKEWAKFGLEYGGVREASESNIQKILTLMGKESGYDEKIVNPTSVGGENASGAMQMLPSTFRAHAVSPSDDIFNGVHNVAASSRYQVDRYGDLVTFSPYKRGGIIPGNAGQKILIQAHAGERVLPREVVQSFDRLANSVQVWSQRQTGTGTVRIQESSQEVAIEKQTERMEAEMKRQTALMRENARTMVKAVVKGVLTSTQSDAWWDGFDREFSAAMSEGDDYVAGANGRGR